jgi:hypothetical protein
VSKKNDKAEKSPSSDASTTTDAAGVSAAPAPALPGGATAVAELPGPVPERFDPSDVLGGIRVEVPEHNRLKTRRYFCGVKKIVTHGGKSWDLSRFQLDVNVGMISFRSETFAWRGKGDLAQQVFRSGAICDLTDEDIRAFRRKVATLHIEIKTGVDKRTNQEIVTGFRGPIDTTDGGSVTKHPNGVMEQHPPARIPGRLHGPEIPLLQMLSIVPAHVVEDEGHLNGAVMTLAMAREMVRKAEEEEQKRLLDPDAYFEAGRGGLLESKTGPADRDPELLRNLNTLTPGGGKVEGGYLGG